MTGRIRLFGSGSGGDPPQAVNVRLRRRMISRVAIRWISTVHQCAGQNYQRRDSHLRVVCQNWSDATSCSVVTPFPVFVVNEPRLLARINEFCFFSLNDFDYWRSLLAAFW